MTTLREDREGFAKLLPGAQYFPLNATTKSPTVKLKARRHSDSPLATAQYGTLLPHGILVVDIDTHTDDKIAPQIAAMSLLLGVDLTKTLTVETPSGGRHFYLKVPDSVDLTSMPNGSLRHLDYLLRERLDVARVLGGRPLDTDFKLGKTGNISYTVGAGSRSSTGVYQWRENPILPISDEAAQTFIDVRSDHRLRKTSDRLARAKVGVNAIPVAQIEDDSKAPRHDALATVHPARISNLRTSLAAAVEAQALSGGRSSFHARRAHVFQLMQCCFSDGAIAQACMLLKIDRDSYTDSRIEVGELYGDIQRMRDSFPESAFHGVVCGKGSYNAAAVATGTLEESLAGLADRVSTRSLSRRGKRVSANAKASVINTTKAHTALAKVARPSSAGFANAFRILEELVQPLSNAGSDRVIMSRSFLSSEFDLTDSQVAKALSILRRSEVLMVRDRQRTGVAPTYCVNHEYVDVEASEILTLERQFRQLGDDVFPALIMDYETRSITEAYTGEILAGEVAASSVALDVTRRYCVDEAARREAIASDEYSMDDWELGVAELGDPESMIKSPIRDLYTNPDRLEDLERAMERSSKALDVLELMRTPSTVSSPTGYRHSPKMHWRTPAAVPSSRPYDTEFARQPRDRLSLGVT